MKKVGIVMGSDSDMPVMSKAAAILDKLGVEYEMKIISAQSVFRCIPLLLEEEILCIQSYRCRQVFR